MLKRLLRTIDWRPVQRLRARAEDTLLLTLADRTGILQGIVRRVEWRWLLERDAARDHGDMLARSLEDFLTTDYSDRRDAALWEALDRYCEDEGRAASFRALQEWRKGEPPTV
jgi:hypothetical protein